jgi:dimethylamine/trimethylamine dehydrogenase
MMGKLSNDKSTGPIVIFDDDRFYMGSIVAEVAINTGRKVVFVTSTPNVAAWSENTLEQERIQGRLINIGVEIITSHELFDQQDDFLQIMCSYSGNIREIHCDTLILVTSRLPNDFLWKELLAKKQDWSDAGVNTVTRIGDCLQPGLIAMAVQSGHNYVREIIDNKSNVFSREDQNFAR